MLAKDVLRVLGITRPTLTKYVKTGIIRVTVLPNKRYDYNEEDVYGFLNKDMKRKTFIYARVSTAKQKPDLENQIFLLKHFCFSNGYTISGIYSDIASGISFEKRKDFFEMLDRCWMKSLKAMLREWWLPIKIDFPAWDLNFSITCSRSTTAK